MMRSKISAKLSKTCLFLVVVFLIVFSPVTGRSKNTSTKCGYVWKWVWVWVWENEYDYNDHRFENKYVYRYKYRYVYDCNPIQNAADLVKTNAPHGEIQKVWVDYDVNEGQKKGIRIHFNFNVFKYKGLPCSANVYFYKASGEPLKDLNGKYKTTGGDVTMYVNFTPGYENTLYNDVQLFMPYDELHLDTGKFDLKFVIELHCAGVGLVAVSQDNFFNYSNP